MFLFFIFWLVSGFCGDKLGLLRRIGMHSSCSRQCFGKIVGFCNSCYGEISKSARLWDFLLLIYRSSFCFLFLFLFFFIYIIACGCLVMHLSYCFLLSFF